MYCTNSGPVFGRRVGQWPTDIAGEDGGAQATAAAECHQPKERWRLRGPRQFESVLGTGTEFARHTWYRLGTGQRRASHSEAQTDRPLQTLGCRLCAAGNSYAIELHKIDCN